MKPESHSLPSTSGDFELEDICLVDDLETEGVSRDSLLDEALSRDPSGVMFSKKTNGGECFVKKLMLPPVLTKIKIEVARKRRECISSFVKAYQRAIGYEHSDAEIARNLEYHGKYNAMTLMSPSDH